MKVFVTGATGFLGSHLVARLVQLGHRVVTLVRDRRGAVPFYDEAKPKLVAEVHGNTSDYHLIERTLHEYSIDVVFHLAAQTQVQTASASPYGTWEANVRGTYTVLDACHSYSKCSRVIVASSDKAYGSLLMPYKETDSLGGVYPYDASKSCVDLIARSYAQTYNMPIVTVRCSNLYGPGDLNWARIVPATMQCGFNSRALTLRGGGTMKRDYLYVTDAVRAYIALANNDKIHSGAFNFGCEKPVEIREIVQKVLDLIGTANRPTIVDGAPCEIRDQWMDCTKAREDLNWNPEVNLDTGLDASVDWYRGYLTCT